MQTVPQAAAPTTQHTVRILGAGPAGLSAAIILARAGKHAVVYEKNTSVGVRFNGDWQGIENWTTKTDAIQELETLGIRATFTHLPFAGIRLYNHRLSPTDIRTSGEPLYYLVRRGNDTGSFDQSLLDEALEAGAEVRFNTTLSPAEADIIATGPCRKPPGVVRGMTFNTDLPNGAWLTIGDELSPQGYTYLLVAGGRATLATVLFSDLGNAKQYLTKTIEAYQRLLGTTFEAGRQWTGQGNFSMPKSAVQNGRLVAGEAAGFQDLFLGFGIRSSMLTGALAAKSLLEGTNYDSLWKARFESLMRTSKLNRLMFAKGRTLAYNVVWQMLSRSNNPARTLRRLYSWC